MGAVILRVAFLAGGGALLGRPAAHNISEYGWWSVGEGGGAAAGACCC